MRTSIVTSMALLFAYAVCTNTGMAAKSRESAGPLQSRLSTKEQAQQATPITQKGRKARRVPERKKERDVTAFCRTHTC
jgi:hypothetical protein